MPQQRQMSLTSNFSDTQMDDILKCGICHSEFLDPRQLKCGHVFCFKCIKTDYETRDRNNGKCPICRTDYWPSPSRAIDSLPQCPLPLRHILSIRRSRKNCCEYCQDTPALYICIRCRLWLCNDCRSKTCIQRRQSSGTHEAFPQHDLEPDLLDIVVRSRGDSCAEHQHLDVKWYCSQCSRLACSLCKINSHVGHVSLVSVETKAQEVRVHLQTIISSLKAKQCKHKDNKATLTELISSCCKVFVDVKHCYTSIDHCNVGIEECEKLILSISKLLDNGSLKVIVENYLNLKERISTELHKRLVLDRVREVILPKPVPTEQEDEIANPDEEHQTEKNPCESTWENTDISIANGDACESLQCKCDDVTCWICLHCRKWLCGSCKASSCEAGRQRDAKHTPLNADIDPTLYDIVVRSRSSSCNTHPTYNIESFCCKCHVPVCNLCSYRHGHHTVVSIAERSWSCRRIMEEKLKQLNTKIQEYSVTLDRLSKIKRNCHFHMLNSEYFDNISRECASRSRTCDDLNKVLHLLLKYASKSVLVEIFCTKESKIEQELQYTPSDHLSEIKRMANFLSETLSDKLQQQ